MDAGEAAHAPHTEPEGSTLESEGEEDEPDFASFRPGPVELRAAAAQGEPPEEEFDAYIDAGVADTEGQWLWVDPRYEVGYSPAAFDLAAFLDRAIRLFQSKTWTRGKKPGRLAVRPDQSDAGDQDANGLKSAAETRGLEVVFDTRVPPGTYWLGLATDAQDDPQTDA
jgi:hypothetical protein